MILERGWQLLMLDVTTSESLSGVSAGFCKSEPKWEGWGLLSYEVKWRGCGGDWMIWAGRGCLGGGCRSQKVRSGVGSRSFLEKGGREGRGGWRFKSAKLGWGERGGRLYVKVVYVPKRCSKKICSQQGRGGSEMKTMHITGQKLINTPENRSVKLSEKWRNQCICLKKKKKNNHVWYGNTLLFQLVSAFSPAAWKLWLHLFILFFSWTGKKIKYAHASGYFYEFQKLKINK